MTAQSRAQVKDLLTRHGLHPSKALGQHFLADPNITRRVVAVAGVQPGDRVLEVGAGTGTLTRLLCGAGARVLALEVDPRLGPVLAEALSGTQAEVRFTDALSFDFAGELTGSPWKMVSNLPYEIGTVLLLDLIRRVPVIESFTVMVQEEVARRLASSPGSREYGLPSVVVGLHGEARMLFTVPPQVFLPPPRVRSAVLQFIRRPVPPGAERAIELAAAAFGQRRKMLRNSLQPILGDPETALHAAGVPSSSRPEDLTPAQFLRLSREAP